MSNGVEKRPLPSRQRPEAPLAHRKPEFPLPRLRPRRAWLRFVGHHQPTHSWRSYQTPLGIGVMPPKIPSGEAGSAHPLDIPSFSD
jgi:hypothetical protein